MPLDLRAGKAVLDVGCGTGALLRAIAETGADAYGLEGSYDRCLVADERVRDLPNAQVMCGSLDDFTRARPPKVPECFDVIVVCGVLEYSGAAAGGEAGHQRFLSNLSRLLAPDGVLALAIENQWGLKYLLSFPEDHLGKPWIGLEGYWRDGSGVRTWSHGELTGLLREAGFQAVRMHAAVPDYKLPSVIVSSDLLDDNEGRTLVKQFVRSPTSVAAGTPLLAADSQLVFQSAVDAGLGLETASSFLVLAGKEGLNAAHCAEGLLWISTAERVESLRSKRALTTVAGEWQLHLVSGESSTNGPLRCSREAKTSVVVGQNVEDLLRRSMARYGAVAEQTASILRRWAQESLAVLESWRDRGAQFDVMPNNFIETPDGQWHMVDTEFTWLGDLADDVCLFRALWYTIERLAVAGIVKGVADETTLEDLVVRFGEVAGCPFESDVFDRWLAFEVDLQGFVLGWSTEERDRHAKVVQQLRHRRLNSPAHASGHLLDRIRQQDELIDRVHKVLDETREEWMKTQAELDRRTLLLDAARDQVREMRRSTSWRVTAPLRRIKRPEG